MMRTYRTVLVGNYWPLRGSSKKHYTTIWNNIMIQCERPFIQ
jgi:hypothetical protein